MGAVLRAPKGHHLGDYFIIRSVCAGVLRCMYCVRECACARTSCALLTAPSPKRARRVLSARGVTFDAPAAA